MLLSVSAARLGERRFRSEDSRRSGPEVTAENRRRVRAQPVVEHARVYGAEIGLVPDVAALVLERRIGGRRIERCGGSVDAATDRAADRHHHARRAMVGTLAAVFRDAAPELGELQNQRLAEKTLVAEIGVEG